jgi:hypothetical protein
MNNSYSDIIKHFRPLSKLKLYHLRFHSCRLLESTVKQADTVRNVIPFVINMLHHTCTCLGLAEPFPRDKITLHSPSLLSHPTEPSLL